jgi:hypothetical protein
MQQKSILTHIAYEYKQTQLGKKVSRTIQISCFTVYDFRLILELKW